MKSQPLYYGLPVYIKDTIQISFMRLMRKTAPPPIIFHAKVQVIYVLETSEFCYIFSK